MMRFSSLKKNGIHQLRTSRGHWKQFSWAQQKEEWRYKFEKELIAYRIERDELGGDVPHLRRTIANHEKAIKAIEDERAQFKKALTEDIQIARNLCDMGIRRLPNDRRFGFLGRGLSEEAKAMKAAVEEKLRSKKHSLKIAHTIRMEEMQELKRSLTEYNKRLQWQLKAGTKLWNIKRKAAEELSKIVARQAKEVQELFMSASSGVDPETASIKSGSKEPGLKENEDVNWLFSQGIKAQEGHRLDVVPSRSGQAQKA
jgi:hypothetical protein